MVLRGGLKKDGWYYILAPAGGVQTGWQVVLRSRNIFGPYEDKIVLEQGSTSVNGPHQGALVDLPNGEWWFLHFQDAGLYGRIVHLQPVSWKDGWPLMGRDLDGNGVGEPVLHCPKPAIGQGSSVAIPQTSDEFDSPTLGRQWQWHANFSEEWFSLSARKKRLRLFAVPMPAKRQKFLARSEFAAAKTARAEIHRHDGTGFQPTARWRKGRAHCHGHGLFVSRGGANGGKFPVDQGHRARTHGTVTPKSSKPKRNVPAIPSFCALKLMKAHGAVSVSAVTGRIFPRSATFSPLAPGIWIGAKVGLFCLSTDAEKKSGHADFAWFRFS